MLNFNTAMGTDLSLFQPDVTDVIKSGQIQKFEFCSEQMWKTAKMLLKINNNIAASSPREAIKEFYNCGYINEKQYEVMIDILDDRNKLSHVYNEEVFDNVHIKLGDYNKVMNEVLNILEKVSIS